MGKYVDEDGMCVYSGLWWKFALPEVILPVHLVLSVGALVWAAFRPSGLIAIAVSVPLGFFVWTLFEYALHRWLLHHMRYPLLRKIFWNGLHREHHMYRQMLDPEHRTIHLAISLPIALLLIGAVSLGTASAWGFAILGGWLLSYCIYETLHWLYHICDAEKGLGKFLWTHGVGHPHTVHHFHHAGRNYGFTTVFWDRVFGTYLPIGQTPANEGYGLREGQPAAANQDQKARYTRDEAK